jgi:type II secretory pathway component PulM
MRAARVLQAFAATEARTRRLALVLVAVVVLAATIGVTAVANASIATARENVLRQRAMLDVARARAKESAALERTRTPAHLALAAAVDQALREHGVAYRRSGDAKEQGDAEAIVVDALPFDVLVRALDALAREHGVRAVEANIAARVDAGSVRAELTLAR